MVLLRREFSRRVASEAGAAARFVSSRVTALGDTVKKSAFKKLNVAKFGRVSRGGPPGEMAKPKTAILRRMEGVKTLIDCTVVSVLYGCKFITTSVQ